MRGKLSMLAASTLLAVSLLAGGAAQPAHATVVTKVVKMTNTLRFMPMTITIHKGDRIKWKNVSTGGLQHTTTSRHWNSGALSPGQTFVHTFRTIGTFRYHCTFHSAEGMTGKIIVAP